MLKIRLTRIGAKKKPFYRVVVKEERSKRDGDYLELLGTYNPLTEPKDIKLKQDRIDHWVKQGAQMSVGFLRIIGKAPQRKPRKPKKSKQVTGDSGQAVAAEQPTEQPVTEQVTEEAKADETVIASETKQSTQDENPTESPLKQIATEPEAPRDDKKEESETKDERPA